MAYNPFVDNKPDIADTGAQVVDAMRENLMALRDSIVMGRFEGFQMTLTGDAEEPATITWLDKGLTDRVRATITWGSAGGANGNPTVILYEFSIDGAAWDTIGTITMTYDANGNTTGSTWA